MVFLQITYLYLHIDFLWEILVYINEIHEIEMVIIEIFMWEMNCKKFGSETLNNCDAWVRKEVEKRAENRVTE